MQFEHGFFTRAVNDHLQISHSIVLCTPDIILSVFRCDFNIAG